tara:strand:- start:967 stop:1194 length:228 start_codon:yes stop_codon:yes gene_type:complete
MKRVKNYTSSVQHNVIATVIDEVNEKGLLLINKDLIGTGKSLLVEKHPYEINTLASTYAFINALHELGYKIVKGK